MSLKKSLRQLPIFEEFNFEMEIGSNILFLNKLTSNFFERPLI